MAMSLCAQMSSLRVSAQRVSLWHRITCPLAPPQPQALAQRRADLAVPVPGAPGGLQPRTLCPQSNAQASGAACVAAGGAHCRALASPPPSLQAPKPFAAAKSLASKANGIAAAPRPVLAQQKQQQQPAASLALKVECADGPRGMKLKTRKVCVAADCCRAEELSVWWQ